METCGLILPIGNGISCGLKILPIGICIHVHLCNGLEVSKLAPTHHVMRKIKGMQNLRVLQYNVLKISTFISVYTRN